jgi:ferric-dicitrate binding protein FerR (iron transport regulator)
MASKYIQALVRNFFESNVSEEVEGKFHNWFVDDESQAEKREAMLDVWENHTAENDKQTGLELKKVKRRIREYENSRRVTPYYKRLLKAAAIILLPLVSAALTYYLKQSPVIVLEPELVEYFVPQGERKHVILSDGSEVWINSGSLLIAEKEFTGPVRTLFLNGEANFSVAPDKDKPFVVKTEYMDITALGTIFNVQSYPDALKTITTLESGKVKINAKRADMHSVVTLSPNEQLIYNRATEELITRKVAAEKNTRWIQGFLVFQSNSFDEIVKVVERRFQVTVQYDPSLFKGRIFTVRFSPDENISQVFDILKDIGGFKYKTTSNTIYINP